MEEVERKMEEGIAILQEKGSEPTGQDSRTRNANEKFDEAFVIIDGRLKSEGPNLYKKNWWPEMERFMTSTAEDGLALARKAAECLAHMAYCELNLSKSATRDEIGGRDIAWMLSSMSIRILSAMPSEKAEDERSGGGVEGGGLGGGGEDRTPPLAQYVAGTAAYDKEEYRNAEKHLKALQDALVNSTPPLFLETSALDEAKRRLEGLPEVFERGLNQTPLKDAYFKNRPISEVNPALMPATAMKGVGDTLNASYTEYTNTSVPATERIEYTMCDDKGEKRILTVDGLSKLPNKGALPRGLNTKRLAAQDIKRKCGETPSDEIPPNYKVPGPTKDAGLSISLGSWNMRAYDGQFHQPKKYLSTKFSNLAKLICKQELRGPIALQELPGLSMGKDFEQVCREAFDNGFCEQVKSLWKEPRFVLKRSGKLESIGFVYDAAEYEPCHPKPYILAEEHFKRPPALMTFERCQNVRVKGEKLNVRQILAVVAVHLSSQVKARKITPEGRSVV